MVGSIPMLVKLGSSPRPNLLTFDSRIVAKIETRLNNVKQEPVLPMVVVRLPCVG